MNLVKRLNTQETFIMTTTNMSGTPHSHLRLVVDDDPGVLKSIAQILRRIPGGEFLACNNPCQALKIFNAAPESIELLVTDFDMPGLDGMQLARCVRAGSSRVQILLISGSEVQATDARSAGVAIFFRGPTRHYRLKTTTDWRWRGNNPS